MNYITTYAKFLKRFINIKRPLNVVFDCSNGTTGLVLKNLLKSKTQNLKPVFINAKPNGNFPGHGPNPWTKGAMNQLQKEVLRQKANLGIIFDADGDRVFFVDNFGRIIESDAIARLLIWQLQPKKVVFDIRTGWLIKKIDDLRFKIYESRVGHFYIKKLMRKINADLGVEKSGHYYFSAFDGSASGGKKSYCDSGIMAAIEVINAVSKLPYKLSDYIDLLPQYYRSPEINIKCQASSVKCQNLLKKIEKYYSSKSKTYNLKTKNYLDGLTMEFDDWPASRSLGKGWPASRSLSEGWWFNLRPSNTEPLIRLNAEALDKKTLSTEVKNILNFLKNKRS